ncbi:MAG: organic hydroperoxide resistance protein [Zunongwangia sp.]|uniref:organic hydroperoxide resistance protein n=1 Tax=Zunongwangia sp. TaxID=1965325 RepID=UPI0023563BA2|tara:strand:- start:941 stop:1351 length:411 start_codon:yes stop_codon:yes gene_type:complete
MEKLYTARASATGGRSGHVKSETGVLDIEVRTPESLGGPKGDYLNPEILFAGGYAACFDNALLMILNKEKIKSTTTTTAEVHLVNNDGAYGLDITLEVEMPGVEKDKAEELVNQAHQVCPYSNATRGNVDVTLVVK